MVLNPTYLETKAKVFQGGYWGDLHRMLGVSSGDKILYVGDHMYADILRSKRTLGWRTCLIIPELENELEVANQQVEMANLAKKYRRVQCQLDDKIDYLRQQRDYGLDVDEELRQAQLAAIKVSRTVPSIDLVTNS
jgi:hypothetical protein